MRRITAHGHTRNFCNDGHFPDETKFLSLIVEYVLDNTILYSGTLTFFLSYRLLIDGKIHGSNFLW